MSQMKSSLLPVDEALSRIAASITQKTAAETIPIIDAFGRVLVQPLQATRTQPPFPASAMDGYAVIAADLAALKPLTMIGESAAGRGFHQAMKPSECVRIFTGAPVPAGSDTILIQENATVEGNLITPTQVEPKGRYVRAAGNDFREGQTFFEAGYRLKAKDMALAASLGFANVAVRTKPRVAILATGDELVNPGEKPGLDQIIAANHLSVMALAKNAGAETLFLGIALDQMDALQAAINQARAWKADILVTMGGASVGDHDLVQAALAAAGMDLSFWKIAMRPGKPLMFGALQDMRVLGLPGNPASSVVCAHLFLRPLIAAYLGAKPQDYIETGRLGRDLSANDVRQDYLRAMLQPSSDGLPILSSLPAQDSSLTSVLAQADALIIRPPFAEVAKTGDICRFIRME
jgi:molybdopterin molybdotransferase